MMRWFAPFTLTLALALAACKPDPAPAPAPPPPSAAPAPTLWTLVGDAPAWLYVDVEALGADPRLRALWDEAGASQSGLFAEATAGATSMAIAWPDPTFSERLNAFHTTVDLNVLQAQVEQAGFSPYTAGRGRVWGHAAHEWAVAFPGGDLIVTGTPEAVRSAIASPCPACESPELGDFNARLTLTPVHRRIAPMLLQTNAFDPILASVAQFDVGGQFSLGADIWLRATATPDGDIAAVAALSEALIDALANALRDTPDSAIVGGLLDRAAFTTTDTQATMALELSSAEIDAIIAIVAAGIPEESGSADGSGDAGAAPSAAPDVAPAEGSAAPTP